MSVLSDVGVFLVLVAILRKMMAAYERDWQVSTCQQSCARTLTLCRWLDILPNLLGPKSARPSPSTEPLAGLQPSCSGGVPRPGSESRCLGTGAPPGAGPARRGHQAPASTCWAMNGLSWRGGIIGSAELPRADRSNDRGTAKQGAKDTRGYVGCVARKTLLFSAQPAQAGEADGSRRARWPREGWRLSGLQGLRREQKQYRREYNA